MNIESQVMACLADLGELSEACSQAGEMSPDGGVEAPDAGSGPGDGGR